MKPKDLQYYADLAKKVGLTAEIIEQKRQKANDEAWRKNIEAKRMAEQLGWFSWS